MPAEVNQSVDLNPAIADAMNIKPTVASIINA